MMQVYIVLSFQIGTLLLTGVYYGIAAGSMRTFDITLLIVGVVCGLAAALLAVLWYFW